MPVITLKNVVLPEPLGPIRPRISPSFTVRLKRSSATTPPKRMDRSSQASSVLIGLPWRFAPRPYQKCGPWGGPSGSWLPAVKVVAHLARHQPAGPEQQDQDHQHHVQQQAVF